MDTCLQQLRAVASRVQRSVDLEAASAATSSNHTVEELEARHSLNRERLALLVVDIKSAEVCLANSKKAAEADRQSERTSLRISVRSSSWRISSRSPSKRFSTCVVHSHHDEEKLQQATADGQSVVVAISNVNGRRKYAVRSAKEGVAVLTHVTEREEAATCITRPLEFDPEMSRVAYAAGVSMLGVLVLSTLYSAGVVGFVYGLGTALEGEDMTPSAKNRAGCLVCLASCAVALGILMSVITWKLMLPHQQRQPVTVLRMLVPVGRSRFWLLLSLWYWSKTPKCPSLASSWAGFSF